MIDKLYIKFYFLLSFVFVYLVLLKLLFQLDFFYVIISLYWVLIIPLKNIFSTYFERIFLEKSIKNLFLNKWFILLFLSIVIWYFISFNPVTFLIILSYIFLLSFKINTSNLFGFWITLFFLFLWFLLFNQDVSIYSTYLAFSFYYILLGLISSFINIDSETNKFFKNRGIFLLKTTFIIFLLLLSISFYYQEIAYVLPYISVLTLIILNLYGSISIDFDSNNDYYKKDIIVICIFIIIFIPIVNDYMAFEEKNRILLLTFLWFLITYVWLNLKIAKLSNNNHIGL